MGPMLGIGKTSYQMRAQQVQTRSNGTLASQAPAANDSVVLSNGRDPADNLNAMRNLAATRREERMKEMMSDKPLGEAKPVVISESRQRHLDAIMAEGPSGDSATTTKEAKSATIEPNEKPSKGRFGQWLDTVRFNSLNREKKPATAEYVNGIYTSDPGMKALAHTGYFE